MSDDYMCPFCVTPWKCNGPHIEPEDMANFSDYVNEWCEEMRTACIVAVETHRDRYADLAADSDEDSLIGRRYRDYIAAHIADIAALLEVKP